MLQSAIPLPLLCCKHNFHSLCLGLTGREVSRGQGLWMHPKVLGSHCSYFQDSRGTPLSKQPRLTCILPSFVIAELMYRRLRHFPSFNLVTNLLCSALYRAEKESQLSLPVGKQIPPPEGVAFCVYKRRF